MEIKKHFYTPKEVADMFNITTATLRFWEKNFKQLNPKRSGKERRQYTEKEIEVIRLINYFRNEQGLSVEGTQKRLSENKSEQAQTATVVMRLQEVKQRLLAIMKEMD